jgi:uncharacterized membrane protein YkvA (DUF1232 family)
MTNQRQTDSVLASPPTNGHSPQSEPSGPEEAAARLRQGMTDRPFDREPAAAAKASPSPRRRSWRRLIRHIPLIDRTLAAYYCARDPQTPLYARLAVFFGIAYFIMPFDLIPDFIPFVAHLDDAAVMLLAIRIVHHRITPEHRERGRIRLDHWAGQPA